MGFRWAFKRGSVGLVCQLGAWWRSFGGGLKGHGGAWVGVRGRAELGWGREEIEEVVTVFTL